MIESTNTRIQKILRLPAVMEITGYSRSSIYLKISQGVFPKPILLGGRAVGWIDFEISEWIEQRIKKSRGLERKQPDAVAIQE